MYACDMASSSSSEKTICTIHTVHFARYVAVDRTKDAPETVTGVDVVTEDGKVVQALGASQRMQPGTFFDKVVYEHLIEMYVATHVDHACIMNVLACVLLLLFLLLLLLFLVLCFTKSFWGWGEWVGE
jgi:hypothetical protein